MDKSLWQTLGAFYLLHSSHMWIQAILLCEKHSTTMQIRIVSRRWFCRRPWRLEVNIRRNSVHLRKKNICANKLDVQETNLSFTQFYGSWNNLSRCRFTHGWDSRSRSFGFSDWSISFLTEPNQQNQRCKRVKTCRQNTQPNMRKQSPTQNTNLDLTSIDHVPSSGTHSSLNAMLYVFEDNPLLKW